MGSLKRRRQDALVLSPNGRRTLTQMVAARRLTLLQVYPEPLRSFASDQVPAPVITIPVVEQGRAALEAINKVRLKQSVLMAPSSRKNWSAATCGALSPWCPFFLPFSALSIGLRPFACRCWPLFLLVGDGPGL